MLCLRHSVSQTTLSQFPSRSDPEKAATVASVPEKLFGRSFALRIFVGNLSFESTDQDVEGAFALYGQVTSAQVIIDRDTGRSKGFGFVEMPNNQEATAAIGALNGKDLKGRPLTVNEARPRTEGGGGNRGGGGGNRGGRY